jgi:hypothetical protein
MSDCLGIKDDATLYVVVDSSLPNNLKVARCMQMAVDFMYLSPTGTYSTWADTQGKIVILEASKEHILTLVDIAAEKKIWHISNSKMHTAAFGPLNTDNYSLDIFKRLKPANFGDLVEDGNE